MRYLLLSLFSVSSLWGQTDHLLDVGPLWSYLWREKETGSEQKGSLYGLQGSYNRIKRYGWYLGADGSYCAGILRGSVHHQTPIRSRYSTLTAEGRLGYTFMQKEGYNIGFTPFLGGGYIEERNNFTHPIDLPIHLKTSFPFAAGGFLLFGRPFSSVTAALSFKVRLPYEPTCKVTNDPDNEPMTQRIAERLHYRVDLPISWTMGTSGCFALTLDPLLEIRTFGTQTNYPFDFIKTKETFLGLLIAFQWKI